MKPRTDTFAKRRKAANDSLRATVRAALASLFPHGERGGRWACEVFVGKPGGSKVWSNATTAWLYHIAVARDWRAFVHQQGIATFDDCLCLWARKAKPPKGMDAAWSVKVFDVPGGYVKHGSAVKLESVIRFGLSLDQAHKNVLSVYRKLLLGEE